MLPQLEGLLRGWDEQHLLKLQRQPRLLGDRQVAIVDRVERAAQQADSVCFLFCGSLPFLAVTSEHRIHLS